MKGKKIVVVGGGKMGEVIAAGILTAGLAKDWWKPPKKGEGVGGGFDPQILLGGSRP